MDPYILLANGKQWWFENPDPAVIDIDVVAGALSRLCRFSGQTKRFYSVAEHSIAVAGIVPWEDKLEALMHDASEAFVVDVPSPLKPLLKDYPALEEKAHRAVAERFGLRYPWPPSVKQADLVMLATEKRDLMPGNERWPITDQIEALPERIRQSYTWPPYWAERFKTLWWQYGGRA